MKTIKEKMNDLARDYFANDIVINADTLGEFLNKNAWQLYDIYSKDCKIEDIKSELEERGLEYTDEDLEMVLEKYEDCLEDNDTWRICLNNAIDYVFGEEYYE